MAWEPDRRLTLIDFAVTCTSVCRDKYEWTNMSQWLISITYIAVNQGKGPLALCRTP